MKKMTPQTLAGLSDRTKLVYAGRDPSEQFGFVNTPIYRGSTVIAPTMKELLDRSGRRVEPTEDGLRFYRGARRLLALEEELLDELQEVGSGVLTGRLEIGASTGPAAGVLALLVCELQRRNPALTCALSVFDTESVIEKVSRRELELGVVGAQTRNRSVVFEPFFRDEVVLACPAAHRFAGRTISLDELAGASADRGRGARGSAAGSPRARRHPKRAHQARPAPAPGRRSLGCGEPTPAPRGSSRRSR